MILQKFLLPIFAMIFTLQSAYGNDWELLSMRHDIQIYRDRKASKGVIPVKAIMEVSNSIEEIVAILLDTKRKAEWAPRVPAVEIIKQYNPYDVIEFAQLAFPWPFEDRYFVVRSAMGVSSDKAKITFYLKSINHPYPPKSKKHVLGQVYNGGMELEKLDNGKIKITAHLFTDPKGSIPSWVVNMFSRKTSLHFMRSLRKQLDRKLYGEKELQRAAQYIDDAAKDKNLRLPATKR